MATSFASASSQILSRSSAVVTAYPFSVSALVKPSAIGTRLGVWGVGVSGSTDNYFRLDITAGGAAQARARTTAVSDSSSTGTMSAGTIYQMGGLYTSATSRQAVLNGVLATASTTSRSPSGMNRTTVGGTPDSGTASYMNGVIYYVAVWDAALSQAEWDMLADRFHPLLVKPQNLVSLWLLNGNSTEIDIIGKNELTPSGSPTKADNDAWLRGMPISWGNYIPAAVSASHTSSLPVAAVSVASLAVSASTTEKHFSDLPVKAVAVASSAISAVTSDLNTSSLPVATVAVASSAVTAANTDNNQSALPVSAIAVASSAVSAATTENHFATLPVKDVAVASSAVSAATTENHFVDVTKKDVSVDAFAVTAETTETGVDNSSLPVSALIVESYAVSAVTTESSSVDTHDYAQTNYVKRWKKKLIRKRKRILRRVPEAIQAETESVVRAIEAEPDIALERIQALEAEIRAAVVRESQLALLREREALERAAAEELERQALMSHYQQMLDLLSFFQAEAERRDEEEELDDILELVALEDEIEFM